MILKYKSNLSEKELAERLKQIRHVALDMDGTIYNGGTLFDYTNPFLQKLKESGITYSFLTNNPSRSIPDYISHLDEMGIKADASEIYTSASATINYLKTQHPEKKRLFILGTPSMIREFEDAGFISLPDSPDDVPDAVLVGFDMTLEYARLCRAAWWISQGLLYLATNPDHVCPTDEQIILPDCGAICAALEVATKRWPDIILGKPDPNMLSGILTERNLKPENIAMVGDRVYTDILMAQKAQVLSVLVLSGESTLADGEAMEQHPDLILENIKDLGDMLIESNKFVSKSLV